MVVNLQILYNRHVHVPTCSTVAKLITGNQFAILHTLEWILINAFWLGNTCNEYVFFFKQGKNSSIWNGKHFWYTIKKNSDLKKKKLRILYLLHHKTISYKKKKSIFRKFPIPSFLLISLYELSFLCEFQKENQ